jgi:hypothetical protein
MRAQSLIGVDVRRRRATPPQTVPSGASVSVSFPWLSPSCHPMLAWALSQCPRPSPLAKLHRGVGDVVADSPATPTWACHRISCVHLRSDDSTSIKLDLILTVQFRFGRSSARPRSRSAAGPCWSVRLALRPLTSLARLLARARVRTRARSLKSNSGRWSAIVRSRPADTPSRGRFARDPQICKNQPAVPSFLCVGPCIFAERTLTF